MNAVFGHTDSVAVLFSGGVDCTVLLVDAMSSGARALAVEVDYEGRPSKEKQAVRRITDLMQCELVSMKVGFLGSPSVPLNRRHPSALLLVSLCEQLLAGTQFDKIAIGTIREDWMSHPNPQASTFYYRRLQEVLRMNSDTAYRLLVPYYGLSKADVVKRGISLGAPIDLCWSCINDEESSCGRCVPCRELIDIQHHNPELLTKVYAPRTPRT